MSDFKAVEVEVIEDPNAARLEQALFEVIDSCKGKELNNIKSINQACDVIRQQTQAWKIDIGEMTVYRFGDILWRRARSWNNKQNLENWIAELIDSYEGTELEKFMSGDIAFKEIRKRSQIWEAEVDDSTVMQYANLLKEKAKKWHFSTSDKRDYSSTQNNETFEDNTKTAQAQPGTTNQSLKEKEPIETPLAHEIIDLIKKAQRKTRGYVYFKEWNLNGHRWYKIGITNNPKRRDAEQNVLPVAPKSLALLKVNSMDIARVIENNLHKLLANQRVKDAQNREIFELKEGQAESIQAALKSFEE